MAIRSTFAAIRPTTTSPRTACAIRPSTAAPTRSTSSRSRSTTAPTRVQRLGQRRRHDQPRLQGAAGRGSHYPLGRDRHRQLLPRHGRHQPARQRLDRGPPQRHVAPERRARPRRRGISAAGAWRPRSPSGSAGHQPDARLVPPERRQHAGLRRSLLPQPAQRRAAARGRRQRLFRLSQPRRAGDRPSTGSPPPSATISATASRSATSPAGSRSINTARPARRRALSACRAPAASRSRPTRPRRSACPAPSR